MQSKRALPNGDDPPLKRRKLSCATPIPTDTTQTLTRLLDLVQEQVVWVTCVLYSWNTKSQGKLWLLSVRFPWSVLIFKGVRPFEQRRIGWPFANPDRLYIIVQPKARGRSTGWQSLVWNGAQEHFQTCKALAEEPGTRNALFRGIVRFSGAARCRLAEDIWVNDSRWPRAYLVENAVECSPFVAPVPAPQSPCRVQFDSNLSGWLTQVSEQCLDEQLLLDMLRYVLS